MTRRIGGVAACFGVGAAILLAGCTSQSVRTLNQETPTEVARAGAADAAEAAAQTAARTTGSDDSAKGKPKSTPKPPTEPTRLPDNPQPLALDATGPEAGVLQLRARAPEPRGIGVSFIGQVLRLTMPYGFIGAMPELAGTPVVKVASDEVMRGRQVIAITLDEKAQVRFTWAGRDLHVAVAAAGLKLPAPGRGGQSQTR